MTVCDRSPSSAQRSSQYKNCACARSILMSMIETVSPTRGEDARTHAAGKLPQSGALVWHRVIDLPAIGQREHVGLIFQVLSADRAAHPCATRSMVLFARRYDTYNTRACRQWRCAEPAARLRLRPLLTRLRLSTCLSACFSNFTFSLSCTFFFFRSLRASMLWILLFFEFFGLKL